jgi:transcriptional regulator with XRE-family HTH domain
VRPIDPVVVDIDQRRKAAGWSLNELARRSGVSVSQVWAICNGQSGTSLRTLRMLAAPFDLDLGPVLRPREER